MLELCQLVITPILFSILYSFVPVTLAYTVLVWLQRSYHCPVLHFVCNLIAYVLLVKDKREWFCINTTQLFLVFSLV
jgi:hypothetical protein